MKKFKQHFNEANRSEFNIPAEATEQIGAGSGSEVYSAPGLDKVYKIPTRAGVNKPINMDRRKNEVNGINELERIGSITVPTEIMHYGTYKRMKEDNPAKAKEMLKQEAEKHMHTGEIYYKEWPSSSFAIDKVYQIHPTHTKLNPDGVIEQDKINGEKIDVLMGEFERVKKALEEMGFYVDSLGGASNFIKLAPNVLAVIDGIQKLR